MNNSRTCAVLFALMLLAACSSQSSTPAGTQPSPPDQGSGAAAGTGHKVEVALIARQFEFEPSTITVKRGDTVSMHLTSADVAHGFFLPDFGINEKVNPGETVTFEFVANKAGSFAFSCSVPCGSGHGKMRGTLVVKES